MEYLLERELKKSTIELRPKKSKKTSSFKRSSFQADKKFFENLNNNNNDNNNNNNINDNNNNLNPNLALSTSSSDSNSKKEKKKKSLFSKNISSPRGLFFLFYFILFYFILILCNLFNLI